MYDGEPLTAVLACEANRFLQEFDPKDLATTVQASGKLMQLDELMFDSTGDRMLLAAEGPRAHDLAIMAWSAGKAQHKNEAFLEMTCCSFLATREPDAATRWFNIL